MIIVKDDAPPYQRSENPVTYLPLALYQAFDNAIKNLKNYESIKDYFKQVCEDPGLEQTVLKAIGRTFDAFNLPIKEINIINEANKIVRARITEAKKENRKFFKSNIGILKIDNYIDNVNLFKNINPFFYDKNQVFWFWNTTLFKWEIVDEVDLMNAIDKELSFGGQTVTSSLKNNYLEAFKRVGRLSTPKEAPKSWIQFKDKIFDYKTKEIIDATCDYFICNPIPYSLGELNETPTMDKLFNEWVGEKFVKTMYEIIAYCCIIDYPIHLLFCLIGSGCNGKTKFQQLITKFVGVENTCSTELDLITDSRFESAKLYKKLICLLGETNFGLLEKTSWLKKLVGQDLVGMEYKNKKPFDAYNYAKIIINSNSLPSSEDTSEGFYRRWLIVDFPNQFQEGRDILEIIPEWEYNNLARKVTETIPVLIDNGEFTNQGTIEERRTRYIMASNPLPFFIQNACYTGADEYILSADLYKSYVSFLIKLKRRIVSRKEFHNALLREGFEARRSNHPTGEGEYQSGYYIDGLNLKENWEKEVVHFVTLVQDSPLCSTCIGTNIETLHKQHNLHKINQKTPESGTILSYNNNITPILGDNINNNTKTETLSLDEPQPPKIEAPKPTPKTVGWVDLLVPDGEEVDVTLLYQEGIKQEEVKQKLCEGEIYESRSGFVRKL